MINIKQFFLFSTIIFYTINSSADNSFLFDAIKDGRTSDVIELCTKDPNLLSERDEKFGGQPLSWASLYSNRELVLYFIENGAKVNDLNINNDTPLILATDIDIVSILLNKNANINAQNKTLGTPLLISIIRGASDIALLLINRGSDLHVSNNHGQTPMHLATLSALPAVIIELTKKGVDINSRDKKGNTPLIYAAAIGNGAIVKVLLLSGADADIEDSEGNSALEIANKLGKRNIIDMLSKEKLSSDASTIKVIGSLKAKASLSSSSNTYIGYIDFIVSNGSELIISARSVMDLQKAIVFQTSKIMPLSESKILLSAVEKSFELGQKAYDEKLNFNERVYNHKNEIPYVIIGFSSSNNGAAWSIYFVFTEQVDKVYVFEVDSEEAKKVINIFEDIQK
jgi:ankyrin repeat protein